MPNFAALQSRVQEIIIDSPPAIVARAGDLVNEAMRTLQTLHGFKVGETQSSLYQTALDTRVLAAVPSDFMKFRGKPALIEQSGRVRELAVIADRNTAEREYGSAEGGEADATTLRGRPKGILLSEPDNNGAMNFEVWPLPDELSLYTNGNYRIRIPYQRFLPALSGDSASNWFTENANEWLVYQAAAQGFLMDWDQSNAAVWTQNASNVLKTVILRDKYLRISMVETLVPHHGVRGHRIEQGD